MRRHFGHAGNGFELVAQIPVLKAAQVGEAVLMAVVDKGVFVDPSRAGCVRTDDGMHAFGQPPGDLLHVLQDARPRPIQIGAVLEDDEDVGIAEHRLRSHGLYVRSREKRRDDRIRDLVFDDAGRLARPRGVDDHFHVGNVRQRVERNVTQSPDSREHKQQCPR